MSSDNIEYFVSTKLFLPRIHENVGRYIGSSTPICSTGNKTFSYFSDENISSSSAKTSGTNSFSFFIFFRNGKALVSKKKKTGKALGGKKAGRDEETSSHYPLHSPPPPTSASCVSQSSRVLSSLRLNRKNSFKQVDASSPF